MKKIVSTFSRAAVKAKRPKHPIFKAERKPKMRIFTKAYKRWFKSKRTQKETPIELWLSRIEINNKAGKIKKKNSKTFEPKTRQAKKIAAALKEQERSIASYNNLDYDADTEDVVNEMGWKMIIISAKSEAFMIRNLLKWNPNDKLKQFENKEIPKYQ